MKNFNLLFGILLFISIAMVSCDDKDSFSLGDFRVDIATVDSLSKNSYALILDNGDRLWPGASDVVYLPKSNQRVFVNYTILSGQQGEYAHYVKINDIWDVLTKSVIDLDENNAETIGDDPVGLNKMWIGGDYLNINFMFNYGGIRPHWINLVNNTLSPNDNDDDIIQLEFRHNSYGSTNMRLFEGFVCFDLKPFRQESVDSVKFSIRVRDWVGIRYYDLVYKYDQIPNEDEFVAMPIPVITSTEYM